MAEEELESFRRQWQAEVSARARGSIASSSSPRASSSKVKAKTAAPLPAADLKYRPQDEVVSGWNFDHVEEQEELRKLGTSGSGTHPESRKVPEPQSALEHYERAVEREGQGKLGDSLAHYRKAFRVGLP
jgi:F-box protein 9